MAKAAQKSKQAKLEEAVLDYWQQNGTFKKSLANRQDAQEFVFYDGPPYANGLPHHGHAVQSILKDAVTRYKTMRGYYVPRRTGWDTHGLPIEYKIEQELGFSGKADIIKYGIDKFNQASRESVFTYVKEWNQFFDRIGRWRDTENQYATLDQDYIESVWWVFAQIYKRGFVYEDLRSTPYCPRCATPLSNFEVNLGYQDDIEDPSLFMKFKVKSDLKGIKSNDIPTYLIGWTTTPWSLPGNAAVAVHPGELYVSVKAKNDAGEQERLILAQKRLSVLDEPYEVEAEFGGQELAGLTYEPLFELDFKEYELDNPDLYQVWTADFVSVEEGSGVLHIATAFGEDDLNFGKDKGLPILSTIDANGLVRPGTGLSALDGVFFKLADDIIIDHLTKQNRVFAAETFTHTYPFCWRCDTPLLYYATSSWFIRVSDEQQRLVDLNQQINWVPEHIKNGRFGKWLEGAKDWAFSRNRFWGAPLPLWRTEDGEIIVVESIEELKKMAKNPEKIGDLHRPHIDDVVLVTEDGREAWRVEEVFDVWFESGSMPYGQDHYPFENKERVEERFPADFIAEAMDQTRGWFYSLHVIAALLFNKPAFKNVITTGWVNAADGQKLSKRLKNYTPLSELFNSVGADPVRFFMLSSPIMHGEDIRFSTDFLKEVERGLFMTLQNTVNFFELYRGVDNWQWQGEFKEPKAEHVLDKWILSRLNQTIQEVTEAADRYEIDRAVRPLRDFMDDLSNWYVRRSRRRFWKSENDDDKHQAYATLYFVLMRFGQILAPWVPFTAEHYFQSLKKSAKIKLPASVHLTDWPEAGQVNAELLNGMASTRHIITEGLGQRAEAGIKVRQPLASVYVVLKTPLDSEFESIIEEELNVKQVKLAAGAEESIKIDTKITTRLAQEGQARELIRRVQNLRKQADLAVDDRIDLNIKGRGIEPIVAAHGQTISRETLALELTNENYEQSQTFQLDGQEITISLRRREK